MVGSHNSAKEGIWKKKMMLGITINSFVKGDMSNKKVMQIMVSKNLTKGDIKEHTLFLL